MATGVEGWITTFLVAAAQSPDNFVVGIILGVSQQDKADNVDEKNEGSLSNESQTISIQMDDTENICEKNACTLDDDKGHKSEDHDETRQDTPETFCDGDHGRIQTETADITGNTSNKNPDKKTDTILIVDDHTSCNKAQKSGTILRKYHFSMPSSSTQQILKLNLIIATCNALGFFIAALLGQKFSDLMGDDLGTYVASIVFIILGFLEFKAWYTKTDSFINQTANAHVVQERDHDRADVDQEGERNSEKNFSSDVVVDSITDEKPIENKRNRLCYDNIIIISSFKKFFKQTGNRIEKMTSAFALALPMTVSNLGAGAGAGAAGISATRGTIAVFIISLLFMSVGYLVGTIIMVQTKLHTHHTAFVAGIIFIILGLWILIDG